MVNETDSISTEHPWTFEGYIKKIVLRNVNQMPMKVCKINEVASDLCQTNKITQSGCWRLG